MLFLRTAKIKEELEGIKFYDKDGTEIVRYTDTENLSPLIAGQQQKTEVVEMTEGEKGKN
jgi:hypothetical protein